MTRPQSVDLHAAQASALLQRQLHEARSAFHADDFESALDCLTCALGIALQLGPAATQSLLAEVVGMAQDLAHRGHADALCALGPALVGLIRQMEKADALPSTPIMHAWTDFTSDLGALIGQLGLALTMHVGHRAGMMGNARDRAALLDDATDNFLALTGWIDQLDDCSEVG